MDRNGPARDPARVTGNADRPRSRRASARRTATRTDPHPGHSLALNPAPPLPGGRRQLNSVDDRRSPSSSLRSSSLLPKRRRTSSNTGAASACPAPIRPRRVAAGQPARRASVAPTSFGPAPSGADDGGPDQAGCLAFGHRHPCRGMAGHARGSAMDQRISMGTSGTLARPIHRACVVPGCWCGSTPTGRDPRAPQPPGRRHDSAITNRCPGRLDGMDVRHRS